VIRTVGEFVDAVNALLESGALTRDMPVKCVWDGCSWPVQGVVDVSPPDRSTRLHDNTCLP
jgi:hypothetical protein